MKVPWTLRKRLCSRRRLPYAGGGGDADGDGNFGGVEGDGDADGADFTAAPAKLKALDSVIDAFDSTLTRLITSLESGCADVESCVKRNIKELCEGKDGPAPYYLWALYTPPGCSIISSFNVTGQQALKCAAHKTHDMVKVN